MRVWTRILALTASVTMLMCLAGHLPAQEAPDAVRGVVVFGNGPGMHSATEIQALMDTVARTHMNRIYPEVRGVDGVFYISKAEKLASGVAPSLPDPISMLNRAALLEADEPIAVWPVITVFPAYNAVYGNRPPSWSILGRFPGAVGMNAAGDKRTSDSMMLADPLNPAAQDYLLGIMLEFVNRYKPEGIVLKDFAYPDPTWGYNEETIADFRRRVGGSGPPPPDNLVWTAYRRQGLTDYLDRVCRTLRQAHPSLKIGIMAHAEGSAPQSWEQWTNSAPYARHFQDWVRWAESGLVDEIVLINLRNQYREEDQFLAWLDFARRHAYDTEIVTAVSGESNFTPDVLKQIRLARARGAGIVLWDYAHPTRDDAAGFVRQLASTFSIPEGAGAMPNPFPHRLLNPSFVRMTDPPPSIQIGKATPTPQREKFSMEMVREQLKTPAPTPDVTVISPSQPDRRGAEEGFKNITLSNGRKMRARILSRDDRSGMIVIQPAGGAKMQFPISAIKSIEDE
ncbi:family 10 glycosylhydrolase [bacterium]|nr:family 10 glycosylhydrolase [bacterium]